MEQPASLLLTHCPPTLPARAYSDPVWFAQEQRTIWARQWVYVGRVADLAMGTMRPVTVANASIILCHDNSGTIRAFHNSCRHRGAEICAAERPMGKLISCPYHAWTYATDGRLVSTAFANPTADFRREDHRLVPVSLRVWNGCIFLNLASDPPDLNPDPGQDALDNWPMGSLRTGYRLVKDIACNWKVFWENYNECLHCPGIHPELSDRVPVYAKGVMSVAESTDINAESGLTPGARSWTMTGAACGPEFPGLTAGQRVAGHLFTTVYPSMFIVAHVDYVRCVSLTATGPETTRLTAEWLFSPETLAQPGFDAAEVARFATLVMLQDATACEMNQRGIRSPSYLNGTLMPQEFDLYAFHGWVLNQMDMGIS